MDRSLVSSKEACDRLGIRPQTLYAYVSRGFLEAIPDPSDPRRSLYRKAEIASLLARKKAGRSRPAIAARTINWGDPVLETHISTISRGKLLYRGLDAVEWADEATVEATWDLLVDVPTTFPDGGLELKGSSAESAVVRGFRYLTDLAVEAPVMFGRNRASIASEGALLLSGLADQLLLCSGAGAIHERVASSWGLSSSQAHIIRRALVLSADHELNASTFAVRVVASTGAALPSALLAGLAALSGPTHGGSTARAATMFKDAVTAPNATSYFTERLALGEPIWGFGHLLYPDGDVRAQALIAHLPLNPALDKVLKAASEVTGNGPNLDAALALAALALGFPDDLAFALFTVGRAIGWTAHAIEQLEMGTLIRPRAHYVGRGAA